MKLGDMLAEPRTAAGIGEDRPASLDALAARLGRSHPLAQALRRAADAGQVPRDLKLAAGFRLLDVGGLRAEAAEGEPGLLLGVSGPLDPPGSPGEGPPDAPGSPSAPDLFPAPDLFAPQESPDPAAPVERAAWIVWGLSVPSVNLFLAPALRRLSAGLPKRRTRSDLDGLLSSSEFARTSVKERVAVEDVVAPLSYRVYPDTSVADVQRLMLGRALSAVPVVGGQREVMGVITAADLLPHVLPRQEESPAGAAHLVARDVMNRSVLCVAPEEGLAEAGRAMVEQGVAQLPVVRDGEMIGFLGRAAVMRAFADTVADSSARAKRTTGANG